MRSDIRRVHITEACLDAAIHAEAVVLPGGIHVSVYGGHLPHIGAVSIAGPDGKVATTQFPTHKDGEVSRRWAEALAARGLLPAVVEAGIHYDAITREGIGEVLRTTEHMLERLIEEIEPSV